MGCTRQVIQIVALQQNDCCRAKFIAEVSCYDPSMLIWLDESGCDKQPSMKKCAYGICRITPETTDFSSEEQDILLSLLFPHVEFKMFV